MEDDGGRLINYDLPHESVIKAIYINIQDIKGSEMLSIYCKDDDILFARIPLLIYKMGFGRHDGKIDICPEYIRGMGYPFIFRIGEARNDLNIRIVTAAANAERPSAKRRRVDAAGRFC